MSRITDLLNSVIDIAVGAAVLASMVAGAVKVVFIRPIEKRLGTVEEDVDELSDKAQVAKERADHHERVLLSPPNPEDDSLVETVEETKEMVEEIHEKVNGDDQED